MATVTETLTTVATTHGWFVKVRKGIPATLEFYKEDAAVRVTLTPAGAVQRVQHRRGWGPSRRWEHNRSTTLTRKRTALQILTTGEGDSGHVIDM